MSKNDKRNIHPMKTRAWAVRAYLNGTTAEDLAGQLGVHASAIHRWHRWYQAGKLDLGSTSAKLVNRPGTLPRKRKASNGQLDLITPTSATVASFQPLADALAAIMGCTSDKAIRIALTNEIGRQVGAK